MRGGKTTYRLYTEPAGALQAKRDLPHLFEIEAFVLTLRLFLQDKDGFSIRAIAALYEDLPVASDLKRRVCDIRDQLNRYLDQPTPIATNGTRLGRRQVLETILYGGLAHVDATLQPEYERWKSDSVLFTVIEAEFVEIVTTITQAIFWIRHVNVEALGAFTTAS